MRHLKVSELKFGMEGSPGFQGNRLAPFLIENIEINPEGRIEMRPGWRVSQTEFEGRGDQLIAVHFVGDREYSGGSLHQRIDLDTTYAVYGRRLFIATPRRPNRWYDLTTIGKVQGIDSYDWELIKPTIAPTVDLEYTESGILSAAIYPNPIREDGRVELTIGGRLPVLVRILDASQQVVKNLVPNEDATENETDNFYNLQSGKYTYDVGDLAAGVFFVNIVYLDDQNSPHIYTVDAIASVTVEEDEVSDIYDIEDLGDLVPGEGTRGGNYLFCYTYASTKHGIETPPSPHAQVELVRSTLDEKPTRIPARFNISNYTRDMPAWADEVRFYVKRIGAMTHFTEPIDIPYDYTHIETMSRERLSINVRGSFVWENEEIYEPFGYLVSKEFETSPNMEHMESIISYAGRIWGYDSSIHSIRFSHIERPDVFPYDNARIVHAIRIDGSWQSRVQKLHVMPGNGGIYVFFPRAIRTIRGQQIVTGIFSLEISPETDIDASGGINGKGTQSPNSVVSDGSLTYYLDTDRKIYSLGGEQVLETEEFSLSIQPHLDAATDEEIYEARATLWENRYHLMLGDKTFILDIQHGYWTTWDVNASSMLHSVGNREDVLYALVDGEVVELYSAEAEEDTQWLWITNYVDLPFNVNGYRVSEVVIPHPEPEPQQVEMKIETDYGETNWKEYDVHRGYQFQLNTFAQAETRVRVYVRGTGQIPQFNELSIGIS